MFAVLPPRLLSFLDFAYFQMFFVMGGTLFVSAYTSCKRGLQFAGACLTAYYLTLLIFYVWPTYGLYLYCSTHAAEFPSKSYELYFSDFRNASSSSHCAAQNPVPWDRILHRISFHAHRPAGDRDVVYAELASRLLVSGCVHLRCLRRSRDFGMALRRRHSRRT
jgi:hypothetical protein